VITPSSSIQVAGVRVDVTTLSEARARARDALAGGSLFQVSTVNMDFLAGAQASPEVKQALARSSLNVPDGAPVVWLGRLLGHRVPERVAGADLAPMLVRDAAAAGAGVFLLGGEQGVAARAAARWTETIPGVRIAGWYEPPRAPVDQMDHDEIIGRIERSGARVLLVAFGHPKQELWIDRNRDRLPVSIAIGVGQVLDLVAGRVHRAPRWMQRAGLEWFYRMAREPRRLAGRYVTDAHLLGSIATSITLERLGLRREPSTTG
jgi:N-acetylglucosaminyldiphosphoundecaprenol N-acetyl-beta-D-mannosaminyltransferase